ncbi:hypothetical protein [uncultured Gilvimarinus sp.]|uniref:hypothetical protein n=1 Tax=uncultured Gilvimarinus sp. TaxID=1689143 RepID=UPI0030DC64D2
MSSNKSQHAFALIKFFSKKEHYLSFKSGTSLFRTPHYYRTCEDIGRGDRSESCLLYWDKKHGGTKPKFIRPDGTDLINQKLQNVLVYPADEPHDAWMQSWAVIGPHNSFENSLEQIQREFGCYFVLLPASKIRLYSRLVEKATKTKVNYGLVRYSDDPMERSLTVKDVKYSYQKEFRFFLGQCSKGELQDRFLELPGLNKLLLNGQSLKLASPNGAIKYCSVGHNSVVAVNP